MRKSLRALGLAVLAVSGLHATPNQQAPDKPRTRETIHYDYVEAPDSVGEMTRAVDAVIRARALPGPSTRALEASSKSKGPDVLTDVLFQVLEVLKADQSRQLPKVVRVSMHVGSVVVGDREWVAESGVRIPDAGTEVVLFLRWWDKANAYVPGFGPASLFVITDGTNVIPHASAKHIREFVGTAGLDKTYFGDLVKLASGAGR
jgi:hypothetical protein